MLLDMLTADVAAKHGHEYSPPSPSPSPSPSGHGSFFSQMPLSMFGSVLRKQTASPAPTSSPSPAAHLTLQPATPDPPDPREPHRNLMAAGPEASVVSPAPSRPASSSSIASADDRPKKRAPRPKTTYNLAQPPPTAGPRQKLHIRPKILLQLHQVVPSRRPKPVYEVIPFSLLAPRSTRRLARTFQSRSRDKLCPNDLLIVKAEDYGNKDEDEKSDEERWGARDVIGIVCPARDDKGPGTKTEVLMDDGISWELTHLPNGGYEFSHTDEHGLLLKSRWIPKPAHARRVSTMSSTNLPASPVLPVEEKKFKFSTISANSRRHPVIATMTRANIEVFDSYAMPSATSPSTPSCPPSPLPTPLVTPSSIIDASSFFDNAGERLAMKTDDALRKFIVVSGIWVAFSENWSPAYSLSRIACASPLTTNPTFRSSAPHRSTSMSYIDSPRSVSPASTIDENRRSIPKLIRTGTQMLHRNTSLTNSVSSRVSVNGSPTSSPLPKTRPRRSNSTGNAEFNPKTSSTRRRFGLGLEVQALPETEEERQSKRSMELARIKELALPTSPTEGPAPTPIPVPIRIVEPPSEILTTSPASSSNPRTAKAQSAYNPVTTAGLWDSGVAVGPGLKTRPTSLVVLNGKKEKAKRKQERSKSKEKVKDQEKERDGRRKSERLKQRFMGIFRKEKN